MIAASTSENEEACRYHADLVGLYVIMDFGCMPQRYNSSKLNAACSGCADVCGAARLLHTSLIKHHECDCCFESPMSDMKLTFLLMFILHIKSISAESAALQLSCLRSRQEVPAYQHSLLSRSGSCLLDRPQVQAAEFCTYHCYAFGRTAI